MDRYFYSFREMISLRGLTKHTVKSYSTYIRAYLDYLSNILHKLPEDVSWAELRDFVQWLQKENKHKAILSLMYSAGLRVGEVCSLRYNDISRSSMRIHICHSKARSDRYAILSHNALDILTQYWFLAGKPTGFLFPNRNDPSRPMAPYSVNQFIFAKETELGLPHRLTCHSFRHSFGTHLYENGADLLTIKALLGHKSLNSTTIYVHLASNGTRNAVSPFDRMGGGFLA